MPPYLAKSTHFMYIFFEAGSLCYVALAALKLDQAGLKLTKCLILKTAV